MKENLQFIGIDVDDKAYHISIYNELEDTSLEFKCGPNPDLLIRALKRHKIDPCSAPRHLAISSSI
jgi:hypothetical protein